MPISSKSSPLGQRTEPSSRRSPSNTVITKIRQRQCIRRKFLRLQSGFYWQTLRDTVMCEEKRPINKYFLQSTAVTTSRDYTKIVKKSMCFKKMEIKWARGWYHGDSSAIWSDFNLIVDNAVAYYPKGHRIHAAAKKLRKIYDEACEPRKRSEWMNNAVKIAHEEGLEI